MLSDHLDQIILIINTHEQMTSVAIYLDPKLLVLQQLPEAMSF